MNSVEEIKRKILPVLRKYDVKKAALFGSVVSGELNEESDIDLLVDLGDEMSLFDLSGLKIEIEEILQKRVDVVTYNSLHPSLRDRILSEQKIIA